MGRPLNAKVQHLVFVEVEQEKASENGLQPFRGEWGKVLGGRITE